MIKKKKYFTIVDVESRHKKRNRNKILEVLIKKHLKL